MHSLRGYHIDSFAESSANERLTYFSRRQRISSFDRSDPTIWIGENGMPDVPSAEVVIQATATGGGRTETAFISIASDESYSVNSVQLASDFLTIDGDLTVAADSRPSRQKARSTSKEGRLTSALWKTTEATSRVMAKSQREAC